MGRKAFPIPGKIADLMGFTACQGICEGVCLHKVVFDIDAVQRGCLAGVLVVSAAAIAAFVPGDALGIKYRGARRAVRALTPVQS